MNANLRKAIKYMKVLNNKKIVIKEFQVLFATLLYCTSFLVVDVGLSIAVYSGLIGLLCVIFWGIDLLNQKKIYISRWLPPVLIMYVITIVTSFHNYNFKDDTKTYYLIIATLALSVYGFTRYSYSSVKRINVVITITGMLFSSLIYFFKFFPDIYKTIIFPFLTPDTISDINFTTGQGYSVFVHSDISYTLVLILFAIYIALFTDAMHPKIIRCIYMGGSLILSQRRTEIVFGITVIAIMYLLIFSDVLFEFIKRHFFIFSILFLGIIIALLSLLSFYVSVRQGFSSENRILMTIYEMKYKIDSSNGRNLLYSIALNLLRKNWFWGLGWMNFSNYSGQSGISMVRNVHNIYIQVILECGVILGLIFVICMLLLLFKCLKKVKRNKISGAGCAMLLYLLLGGMTDNTIYYPYFWIIFEVSLYISSI